MMIKVFEFLGVDYRHLCLLLQVKKSILKRKQVPGITIDNPSSRLTAFILQLVMFAVLGLLPAIGLLFDSVITGMTFSFTVMMAVLGITFFSRFTVELLDSTENQVLFPKPISGRTILAARLLHIFYSLSLLAFSFSLATLAGSVYKYGLVSAFVFFIAVILLLLLLLCITEVICLLALKHADPTKVQNLSVAFLIVVIAVFMGALPMFMTRFSELVNEHKIQEISITGTWLYFYPPAWFAGLLDLLQTGREFRSGVLAALALLLPLPGFVLATYIFGKKFSGLLSAIDAHGDEQRSDEATKGKSGRGLRLSLLDWVHNNPVQRGIYLIAKKVMLTDSAFKLRTYPTIGIMLAYAVSFPMLNSDNDLTGVADFIGFLVFIYSVTSFMATTVTFMQYGREFQAGWVYQVLPIAKPGDVLKASVNAFLVKFILPVNVLVIILCATLWGVEGGIHATVASLVSLLMCVSQGLRMKLVFPFSQDIAAQTDAIRIVADQFFILLPIVGCATLHALLGFKVGYLGIIGLGLVVAVLLVLAYRKLIGLQWSDFNAEKQTHVSWNS